jgi:hypothetical protein
MSRYYFVEEIITSIILTYILYNFPAVEISKMEYSFFQAFNEKVIPTKIVNSRL